MNQPLAAAAPVAFVLTRDRRLTMPFYAETLGLKLVSEDPFAAVFDIGGGAEMRLTTLGGHKPSAHTVLGWEVADIRATMASLQARGVAFMIYEGFGQDASGVWTSPDGGAKIAWFNDPEGNNLSIAEHRKA